MGLGARGPATEYRRPHLNLNVEKAGVMQLVAEGMHCAALTHVNKILTWGVHRSGAFGRDTA